MNKIIKSSAFFLFTAIFLIFLSATAYAAVDTNYAPLTTIPGIFTANKPTNPISVIKGLYGLAIGIGSVAAVVMIIFAGFKYMYAESIFGKSDARQMIENAAFGFLVILGSYLLLRTINPALVDIDVTLQGGRGKLTTLISLQQKADAIEKAVNTALINKTLRTTEIYKTQTHIGDVTKELGTLEELKKEALANNDTAAAADYDKQIKTLQEEIKTTQADLNNKIIADKIISAKDIIETGRSSLLVGSATQLADNIKNGSESYTIGTETTLVKLSAQSEEEIRKLSTLINEAQAAQVTGTDAEKRDAFIASAQQDAVYLAVSKNMIDETLAINKPIPTTVSTGVAGGTVTTNLYPSVGTQSAQYDTILSNYNQQIENFKQQGRTDLSENLKNDMNTITSIMKIRNSTECAKQTTETRATLILCQP